MAHFAELDENNIVVRVIVVNNGDCLDQNGIESETVGIAFCKQLLGGRWIQTSYNGNFRRKYAGIGFSYYEPLDVFVEPQPYLSWTFDTQSGNWTSPVPRPDDGLRYRWDEGTLSWVMFVPPTVTA